MDYLEIVLAHYMEKNELEALLFPLQNKHKNKHTKLLE